MGLPVAPCAAPPLPPPSPLSRGVASLARVLRTLVEDSRHNRLATHQRRILGRTLARAMLVAHVGVLVVVKAAAAEVKAEHDRVEGRGRWLEVDCGVHHRVPHAQR